MPGDTRTHHLLPVLRPGGLTVMWWTCLGVAGAALVLVLDGFGLAELEAMGPAFWVIAGLVVLADLRPIVASGSYDPQGVNLSTAFIFATLVRWGIEPALVLMVVGTLLGEAVKRKRVWIALFNTSQYALSYLVAGAVLVVFGLSASPTAPLVLEVRHLPVLMLAAGIYHATNLVLVSGLLSVEGPRSFREELVDDLWWYTVTTLAVMALSPLIVAVADDGWAFILLLIPPLYAVYRTAQMSLQREHESRHDELTGLANRTLLTQRAEEALADSDRDGGQVALAILDLDRFKEINDTLGHQAGDELLVLVASRILGVVRTADTVARLGGDEFALLLTDVESREQATETATRVRAALSEPFQLDGLPLDLDASIGLAFGPDQGDDVQALMRCADIAMYEAKDSRRGVEIYASLRDRHSVSRLGLLGELRGALERDELVLHYQPKVTFADRRIVGIEALVRWQHPERGILAPGEFLPLADQAGLMPAITRRVLEQALAQTAGWRAEGIAVPVAVNVSVHDLADPGFTSEVAAGLERFDLPASLLQLEITEHVLMADLGRLAPALGALDELGVRLSLDDFGTGYSSLAHLRRLPVSEVKIDRAFVQRMTADDVVIMRAIVTLAHQLQMTTVAEGVETAETWRTLHGIGCDAAQGWLLSRAVPVGGATTCLRRHRAESEGSVPHAAPALDARPRVALP